MRIPTYVFAVCMLAGSNLSAQTTTITVDTTQKYQTMEGWEASVKGWEDDKVNDKYDSTWSTQNINACLPVLVNTLGIDRVRLEVKSGTENPVDYWTPFINGSISYTEMKSHRFEKINDNGDPNSVNPNGFQFAEMDWKVEHILLPMQAFLAAKGESLYVNLSYGDFFSGQLPSILSHGKNPAEYAELIVLTFQHLKSKYNIVPKNFEIVNEPENCTDWNDGNVLAKAVIAVAPALNAAGFYPEIAAPSCANLNSSNYHFGVMKNNFPACLAKMTTLTYHRYGGVTPATLQTMAANAKANGFKTGMGEKTFGDNIALMEDLKLVNVSFWQQWGMAGRGGNSGNFYLQVDLTNPTAPVVALTTWSNLFQQFFKYIRRAVRVEAASSDTAHFNPAAFKNVNGKYVVVVNNSSAASFTVSGLPAGTYGITYSGGVAATTATASNVSIPDVIIGAGGAITAHGAAAGTVTIFGKPAGTSAAARPAPFAAGGLAVFPNPSRQRVTFMISGGSENGLLQLEIFDPSGKRLKAMTGTASRPFTFAKGVLPSGVYLYKFYANHVLMNTGKFLLGGL